MPESFAFASHEIAGWRARLVARYGPLGCVPRRRPVGQLVKSIISSSTRDAVSLAAYRRLGRRWGRAAALAEARPAAIEAAIFDVTYAEKKADYLPAALALIGRERPDFDLAFLGGWPVPAALAWLERLPGVGRKVAAATLTPARSIGRCSSSIAMSTACSAASASCASGRAPPARPRW